LGTETHGRSHGHLHCSAERDTSLKLAGNALSNETCIQLRTLNLENVDLHLLVSDLLQLLFQLINLLSAFTNDDSRTGGVHCNSHKLKCALDDDLRDACLGKTCTQILTDLVI